MQEGSVADDNISSKGGNEAPDTSKVSTGYNDGTGSGLTKADNEVSTSPKQASLQIIWIQETLRETKHQ